MVQAVPTRARHDTSTFTLRRATFDDVNDASALRQRCDFPAVTAASWKWIWEDNPVLPAFAVPMAIGWTVHDGERMVGYCGNVPVLCSLGGRTLRSAAGRSFVVDPDYRRRGIASQLTRAYLEQDGVDFLFTNRTNRGSQAVMLHCQAQAMFRRPYRSRYMWILRGRDFLAAALQKKGVPAALTTPAAWFGSPALNLVLGRKHHSEFRGDAGKTHTLRVSEIGEEFDAFWQRVTEHDPRLLLCRRAAVLRWYYRDDVRPEPATFVVKRDAQGIAGYAALIREDVPQSGLKRLFIADLIAHDDSAEVIDDLLAGIAEYARTAGIHVLETIAFPPRYRERLAATGPLRRTEDFWGFACHCPDASLAATLAADDAWFVSPCDGDACLFDGVHT